MTGPAEGKLKLRGGVYLSFNARKIRLENAFIYIHLKGYALARVTHLDVEHEILDDMIPPKRGRLLNIVGVNGGIEIQLEEQREIEFQRERIRPSKIEIVAPLLNGVLGVDEKTRTWVGGKFGGIYIGFRKPEIEKLENIAETHFKMETLSKSRRAYKKLKGIRSQINRQIKAIEKASVKGENTNELELETIKITKEKTKLRKEFQRLTKRSGPYKHS